MSGKFLTAGVQQVIVGASWQTDRTKLGRIGPGRLERRPVYESLPNVSTDVRVLAGAPIVPTFGE